jgi:ketosteroid isomerase-like protein
MRPRGLKRRSAALAACALAILPLAACGKSEEDTIRDTAQRFFDAERAGDVKTLCDMFAEPVRNQFKTSHQRCERVLAKAGPGSAGTKVTLGTVSTDQGDRASVAVTIARAGAKPATRQLVLEKEGGEWKVASGA